MEISITEMFLLLWACLASAAMFHSRGQYKMLSQLLYALSMNKELREEFFAKHDALLEKLNERND